MSTGTLVDSNVLLDVMTRDATWCDWSTQALATAAEAGPLWINPVIYAEVSVRFTRIEDLDDALPPDQFRRSQLPWDAAFLAGKAFLRHRRGRRAVARTVTRTSAAGRSASGTSAGRASTLPDFYIGAHAAVSQLALLTRDVNRYRAYFPTVHLVAPSRDNH